MYVYYYRTYEKAVSGGPGGGRGKREDLLWITERRLLERGVLRGEHLLMLLVRWETKSIPIRERVCDM